MKNIDNRLQLETGDILVVRNHVVFWKPLSWITGLIRVFTSSPWNHTSVVIELWGQPFVLESLGRGVTLRPYYEWSLSNYGQKKKVIMVMRHVNKIDKKKFAMLAMSKVGHTKYWFLGTLFFQAIYNLTRKWIGPTGELKAGKKMYCSQFVAWCYNKTYGLFPDWIKTVPKDIAYNNQEFDTIFYGLAEDLNEE